MSSLSHSTYAYATQLRNCWDALAKALSVCHAIPNVRSKTHVQTRLPASRRRSRADRTTLTHHPRPTTTGSGRAHCRSNSHAGPRLPRDSYELQRKSTRRHANRRRRLSDRTTSEANNSDRSLTTCEDLPSAVLSRVGTGACYPFRAPPLGSRTAKPTTPRRDNES